MYSVDYLQKLVEFLVPDKRTDSIITFNTAGFLDVQNLHDNLFTTYKTFQSLPQWAAGTYNRNVKVIYKKAVYQSLINGNTQEPTFGSNWQLISPNFFGNDNLLKIRGEKLVLEYALNTWFGTTFRQPPASSDIYIVNNVQTFTPFIVGINESKTSNVGNNSSSDFVGLNATFADNFNCTIKVPVAVFNALGSNNTIRENIIRDFADKYINCGIIYKIATY